MEKTIEVIFLKQAEEFTNSIENNPKRNYFGQYVRPKTDYLGNGLPN